MNKINKLFIFFIILISIFSFVSCKKDEKDYKVFDAMDTVIVQSYFDENADEIEKDVFELVTSFDELFSKTIESSQIYNLNKNKNLINPSLHLKSIIEDSIKLNDRTNGTFDISIGLLTDLWDVNPTKSSIPNKDEIKKTLELSGMDKVTIQNETISIGSCKIDLGAIAKGYIGDEIKKLWINSDIKAAYISLGGNMVVYGNHPENRPFRIGIKDPRGDSEDYLGVVEVNNSSVVTSGDYERYFILDGIRYNHIMNPLTGFPVDNELMSVSIIGEKSMICDVLSTSVFIMGLEEGYSFLEDYEGYEGVFVTKDNKIYLTKGASEMFYLREGEEDYEIKSKN